MNSILLSGLGISTALNAISQSILLNDNLILLAGFNLRFSKKSKVHMKLSVLYTDILSKDLSIQSKQATHTGFSVSQNGLSSNIVIL
jgi:hypothetical protein